MPSFNSKETYERLMAGHLPASHTADTFTAYSHGRTVVGFSPYRGRDVRKEGKDSYCQVRLAGYGLVWAALSDQSDFVELLGWGSTSADLSDFAPDEQTKLRTHRDNR